MWFGASSRPSTSVRGIQDPRVPLNSLIGTTGCSDDSAWVLPRADRDGRCVGELKVEVIYTVARCVSPFTWCKGNGQKDCQVRGLVIVVNRSCVRVTNAWSLVKLVSPLAAVSQG